MRIPNENVAPKVLVKTEGGLNGVAEVVAKYLNRAVGNTFCDTDVGSGAIFCRLRGFERAVLLTNDERLRMLYMDIRDNVNSVITELKGVTADKDTYEKYKSMTYSPGREFYLRTLGYGGWWCGERKRLRKGIPEHLAAWQHALTMLPAVSYKLRNCVFSGGLECDIRLAHTDDGTGTHVLMRGYSGEGKLLCAFKNGLALWRT